MPKTPGPKRPEYEPKNPEQALGYLIEECGEVLQAAGKTIRWGGHSINPELKPGDPFFGETNWQWLSRELGDLDVAIQRARRFCEPDPYREGGA